MRPYFALIKDSFRAAIASRVLYVLVGLITLLLLVIAPLHVVEILDWQIVIGKNVSKPDQLARRLVERGEDPEHPAVMRVWEMLDASAKSDVTKWVEIMDDETIMPDPSQRVMHEMNTQKKLVKGLNEVIKNSDFYDEEAWASKRLNDEAQQLIDAGVDTLNTERMRRLNRLLMASALGGLVQRGSDNALDLRYAIWPWEDMTFNISHNEFAKSTTSVLTYVFDKFVLSFGLLVAIMVTANFIPETFSPGSLNLLLSKPISRWGLLLAKFVGGCAFISLCAVYLFVGVWLWLGLAMGIWDKGILWGIPLYIIVFAIYYSVSTLVGLWSHSPILSIIMTLLFWAFCFGVGLSHQAIGTRLSNAKTLDLIPLDEQLLHIGEMNAISNWDEANGKWEKQLEINMMQQQRAVFEWGVLFMADTDEDDGFKRLGPIVDPKSNQVIAGMIDLADPSTVEYQDLYISPQDSISFKKIGKLPRNTIAIFPDANGVIAVENAGKFWRFELPDQEQENGIDPQQDETKNATARDASQTSQVTDENGAKQTSENAESMAEKQEPKKKKGFLNKLFDKKKKEPFKEVGPEQRTSVYNARRISYNRLTRDILIQTESKLMRYRPDPDGNYQLDLEKELEEPIPLGIDVILSAAGDTVVMALGNGQIRTFDSNSLTFQESYRPQSESMFKLVRASDDGRYFVFLCRNKTVWLLDTQKPEEIARLPVSGQGSITAAEFDEQNQLWIGNWMNNAQLYQLDPPKRIESRSPKTGWLAKVYQFGLDPFYQICPKPGEFYKVIGHLSDTTDTTDALDVNLSRSPTKEDPWQPLWSGLAFMFLMLALGCLVFQFKDY